MALGILQALWQASALEALQLNLCSASVEDLELISSLPSLRKLSVLSSTGDENGHDDFSFFHDQKRNCAAATDLLQKAMPHLCVLRRNKRFPLEEFVQWAFGH